VPADDYQRQVFETAAYLKARVPGSPEPAFSPEPVWARQPRAAHHNGSRLRNTPHFPVSTVESHTGRLLFGELAGQPVIAMQGRFHLYEGYTPAEVTFPIRVMQALGVRRLIVTKAAGGLNPALRPGDMMLISDHINLTGENPLTGPNVDLWGLRFPDMSRAYDRKLIALAEKSPGRRNLSPQGVYAGLKGPSMETPAETRFLKSVGAEAVGFPPYRRSLRRSTAGCRSSESRSSPTSTTRPPRSAALEDIIAIARRATPSLEKLLAGIMGHLDD